MRDLLSGALPAPEDEPQQRDVIDAAMDWGSRRRRRDLAMTGAAALAVVAIGAGAATLAGGSGSAASPASGQQQSAVPGKVGIRPSGPRDQMHAPLPQSCNPPAGISGSKADYCRLWEQVQNFDPAFAAGSVPFIQADLPAGYTATATSTWVVLLTGPDGKTNYLYPSTEPASTLDQPLQCATPKPPTCVQTSTAGGRVVVNGGPTDAPSAGYVKDGLADPRVDLLVGVAGGSQDGLAAPTSPTSLLTNAQLVKIVGDPKFLAYATAQLQHQEDLNHQLQTMLPPSQSGSGSGSGSSSSPPSGGPTGSALFWNTPGAATGSTTSR